jgi:hypothetical protein
MTILNRFQKILLGLGHREAWKAKAKPLNTKRFRRQSNMLQNLNPLRDRSFLRLKQMTASNEYQSVKLKLTVCWQKAFLTQLSLKVPCHQ